MQSFKMRVKVFLYAILHSVTVFLLICLLITTVIFVIGFHVLTLCWDVESDIDDYYAEWGAFDLVTEYMREHEGEWPRSWDDLRELYEAKGARVSDWTFEKYQSRMFIDFTADPKELRTLSLRPGPVKFNAIKARRALGWAGGAGNETLRNYFRLEAQGHTEESNVGTTD
ncbi:hypothetical protein [Schlesneria sp.]|uniref:hypothetical protein n=1 Tax=Schlesneria sp. TaxID=2762018 RepID=UPI002F0F1CF6